jgi:phage terminase large subunit-like protein
MENSYNLRSLIKDSTQSELTLKNNMKIISLPCNSTAGRGLPIACLIFDEIAHFYTEGVKADEGIFNALRPRQVQFPGCKLMMISTPAAKQGLFFNFFDEGFKTPGRLTAQAPTLFMNPMVNKAFLEKEKKRDIDNYNREFMARFAEKVEAFLSYELVENSLKLAGDLPYKEGYRYYAGIDASGLAGADKFSLAIAHRQGINVFIDKVISWNLKDPDPIMKDIKELTRIYHINNVSIDRYARGWVLAALRKIGLFVNTRPALAEIYVNIKSLMLGGRLFLPDNKAIKKAFLNTSAYYGRNNALSIAHERDSEGHSDEADAISTAVFDIIMERKEESQQIIHNDGPGFLWVENPNEPEKFNWLHKVPIDENNNI